MKSGEVTLKVTRPKDAYERFGCQIEVEGARLDHAMIQAGAAWLYKEYANDPSLIPVEQEARNKKRGLWKDSNPEYPPDYRQRTKSK